MPSDNLAPPTTVGMMSPTKTWGQSMTHSASDKFLQLGCWRKVTHVGATKLKLMMLFQHEKKNLDFCDTIFAGHNAI